MYVRVLQRKVLFVKTTMSRPDYRKLFFTNFHITLPNANKYTFKLDKKIIKSKIEHVFWEESTG